MNMVNINENNAKVHISYIFHLFLSIEPLSMYNYHCVTKLLILYSQSPIIPILSLTK